MIDINKLQKISDYLDSEEGQLDLHNYFTKLDKISNVKKSQLERFWNKYNNNFNYIVEKIIKKYESDKYNNKWRSLYRESPKSLYYLLYDIAKLYGRKFTEDEYKNSNKNLIFTHDDIYVLGEYTFELIHGQGSDIIVEKYIDCFNK